MSSSATPSSPLHVVVLMPLRDDWASAAELISKLDQAFSRSRVLSISC